MLSNIKIMEVPGHHGDLFKYLAAVFHASCTIYALAYSDATKCDL